MKDSRLPVLLSLAALAVSVGLLAYVLWSGGAPAAPAPPAPAVPAVSADPVADYRLEKLNEVNDMVLRREVVPADYLRYLPENLWEPITQYNAGTALLHQNYIQYGKDVANSLIYEHKESPGDYEQPELYYQWVGRIAGLALHRNANELMQRDPILAYPLAKEAGGSYGLWAYKIHTTWGDDRAQQAKDYFVLVDDLLADLETARGAG